MPLDPGSVSVSASGQVTKSGCAEAIFDALVTMYEDNAELPTAPTDLAALYTGMANGANSIGPAIINYLIANGSAGGDPIE